MSASPHWLTLDWQPHTRRTGLAGVGERIGRAARALSAWAADAVLIALNALAFIGALAILTGSGELEGRRLVLWGAGTLAFIVAMGWAGWLVLS